jgi:uncharacterized iron-regulated membrane protein
MKIRPAILWLHRWVGLAASVIVFVVAVTGCFLAFEEELDRALHPEFFQVARSEERLSVDALVEAARQKFPRLPVMGLRLPQQVGEPIAIGFGNRARVFLDPHDGRELGVQRESHPFIKALNQLHIRLMLGPTGATIVGVATLVTLALALSGLWLWWPLRIVWFKGRPSWRRLNFDLHNVAGLYSSLFLVIVCITGVTMAFADTVDPWIIKLTGAAPRQRPPQVTPQPDATRISIGTAVQRAAEALPGAKVVLVSVPFQPRATYRLQLRFPNDKTPGGRSIVHLDPYSGEVLQVFSTRGADLGNTYLWMQRSLHTGDLFGWPTQVLACLVCVALALQVVSGVVIWWPWRKRTTAVSSSGPSGNSPVS